MPSIVTSYGYVFTDVNTFHASFSEFLTSPRPNGDAVIENLEQAARYAKYQERDMGELDVAFMAKFAEVRSLLEGIRGFCEKDPLGKGDVGFNAAALQSLPWFNRLSVSDTVVEMIYATFFDQTGELKLENVQELLRLGGNISTTELAVLVKIFDGMDLYTIVAIGENSWGAQGAFQLLTGSFAEQFETALNGYIQHGGDSEELMNLMMQVQLLSYFGNTRDIVPGSIGSGICFYSDEDDVYRRRISITVDGVTHQGSRLYDILVGTRAMDDLNRAQTRAGLETLEAGRPTVSNAATRIVAELLLEAMLLKIPPFVATIAGGAVGHRIDVIAHEKELTAAQAQALFEGYIWGVYNLGGGIMWMQTPEGLQFLGENLYTPNAIINNTLLANIDGMSHEAAVNLFIVDAQETHRYMSPNEANYRNFVDRLNNIIREQFPEWGRSSWEGLSVPQLQQVIEVWEVNNR